MNVDKIRKDFPVLQRHFHGKTMVYFDNACMSLRPQPVIAAMNEYYENYPACAGRSAHKLSAEAERNFDEARKKIARFIGAKADEIIFTKNATEGINLVAHAVKWEKGDMVLTSDREHNSNLLPWQLLKTHGVSHMVFASDKGNTFSNELFEKSISKGPRLISSVHVSNVDGYEMPAREMAKAAHDGGALFLVDGAQSAPHMETDVHRIGCDFFAFSGHKMLGPSIGVLYVKKDIQSSLLPFMVGGGTVEYTNYESHKFLKPPEMFEAGLQNYAGAMGLAAAADYLARIGMKNVERHEQALTEKIRNNISSIKGVEFVGAPGRGIISFNVKGMGFHDVAIMMDELDNIMIRSGQHCVHSWFNARNIKGSCRASFYIYNDENDAERFAACLKKVAGVR